MSSVPDLSIRQFDFDENPETASTLPAATYFDRDWFELEKRRIFRRNWRCVGHVNDIADKGDYVTDAIVDQPVFALRCRDGSIRAFHNVCKHRAHLLLTAPRGTLKSKLITCPYHAWAYDNDGCLQAAPHCESIRGFDKSEIRLDALKVEIILGFIFVNADLDAADLLPQVAPGVDRLVRHLPDLETYRLASSITFDIAANWKNVGDNLLECYHCQPAHKAFVDLVDMDSYSVEVDGLWSWQGGICRPENTAYNLPAGLSELEREFATFYIWPDVAFVLFPGSRAIASFVFGATAAESTHQVFSVYTPDGELDDVTRDICRYFNDVLGPEDVALVENVQKGLHSMSYSRGRFFVDPERSYYSEHAVHHLHGLVFDHLRDFFHGA
ncbi:MAG: aromatic ring-hydroxylating dioxygenase subunit alpha [Gammaproteobacteria bacterium]|nr:aromatic ring-hydroxylating dioxygenase subunit alpha [Gammaproteobacteria bacterium]